MTRLASQAPAAVLALLAAVAEANPDVPPTRLAQLQIAELDTQGWHVGAPGTCRPTGSGAEQPSTPYLPAEV